MVEQASKKTLNKLDKNVQKWAARLGAVATIIGVLTAGGAWVINQIDNNLASRIENQTAAIQTEVKELSSSMEDQNEQTELQLTRLELMALITHDPDNVVEIEKVAYHYFRELGGNYYMDSEYSKWCKTYGADCEIMLK